MRYGYVARASDHITCMELAADLASQPQMSLSPEPMRLTVRKVDDKWEAAWETRES